MNSKCLRVFASLLTALSLTVTAPASLWANSDADNFKTATPIKHLVVIFQENISFDHYFATYPHATNPAGEPAFHAKDDTPRVNSLKSSGLLANNPNGPTGPNGQNPFRMDRSHVNTCDEDHVYGDEQYAFHAGLMDRFTGTKPGSSGLFSCNDAFYGKFSVMGYFDGNTVTALWNYAQNFAMSDNSYSTSFGPSTPGLLNLLSGNTYGATLEANSAAGNIAGGASFGTVIGDPDPFGDKCSAPTRGQIRMTVGKNVGDLLNTAGVTWGAFMGGFNSCTQITTGLTGLAGSTDYIPHHAFFQYWLSTLNANHTPPVSAGIVGQTDGVTFHQYDLSWFFAALKAHNLPAVSILKAPAYQDGHAGYSDPLDEQLFLVNTINALMKSDEWKETAVIILYDDSDGWYDHQMGPIVMQSNATEDQLVAPGNCGTAKPIAGVVQNARCGYGPRQPLLVISPYAKHNYVDHRVTDQASVLRFIEDNWNLGRIGGGSLDAVAGTLNGMFDFDDHQDHANKLILDPSTGLVISHGDDDH
jgi:phospholipase C